MEPPLQSIKGEGSGKKTQHLPRIKMKQRDESQGLWGDTVYLTRSSIFHSFTATSALPSASSVFQHHVRMKSVLSLPFVTQMMPFPSFLS